MRKKAARGTGSHVHMLINAVMTFVYLIMMGFRQLVLKGNPVLVLKGFVIRRDG